MNVFDEMDVYWEEIADQNQTDRQIKFIKNTLKPEGFVLDFACGTGRHLIPFKQGRLQDGRLGHFSESSADS